MTVITYGTFDLFHYGHYNLIKNASKLGDKLIVGVSSDEMCKAKGKAPIFSEEKRIEIISSFRFVDQVIIENSMAQKVSDVKKYNVDIFCLGSDYEEIFPKMPEYQQLIDLGCKVVFLPRTPEISTSNLKEKMFTQIKLDLNDDSLRNKTKKD